MGYAARFRVTRVDRDNGCKRTSKFSAKLVKAIFDYIVAKEPEHN
jgi:beta-glucosidase/6-phospho-beta-glucosidase/beta-galactosidase